MNIQLFAICSPKMVDTSGRKRQKTGEQCAKKTCKSLTYRFVEEIPSARDEIRTHTPFRALPPQSSASTNFATHASTFKFLKWGYQIFEVGAKIGFFWDGGTGVAAIFLGRCGRWCPFRSRIGGRRAGLYGTGR